MNVASLELSKELYELSNWWGTDQYYYDVDGEVGLYYGSDFKAGEEKYEYYRLEVVAPAYSLGYLLRGLPRNMTGELLIHKLFSHRPERSYSAVWQREGYAKRLRFWAETPEDAACKLAIELFKQGGLVRIPYN